MGDDVRLVQEVRIGPGALPGRAGNGREPWLRTGVMLELLGPSPGARVLLVGEREGILAARLTDEKKASTTWLTGRGHNVPFKDNEFDAVASQFALEYLDDPHAALAEWARVLKNGGTLALVTRNALFRGPELRPRAKAAWTFTPVQLPELVAGAGLEVREVRTLIPDLRLPRLYRGDLSFSHRFERLPYFRERGILLFVGATK